MNPIDVMERRVSPWPASPSAPYRSWIGQLLAVAALQLGVIVWNIVKLSRHRPWWPIVVVMVVLTLALVASAAFLITMALMWRRKLRSLR